MSTMTITTPSDREIKVTRDFAAPRSLVWDALTKPELLKQWLLGPPGWTMPVCEMDPRPGGKYRYVWRKEGQPDMGMGGVFKEVTPPERMVVTERFDQAWYEGDALITQTLTEKGGKTTLSITMQYGSKAVRDGVAQSGMATGMEASYDRLADLLTAAPAGKR